MPLGGPHRFCQRCLKLQARRAFCSRARFATISHPRRTAAGRVRRRAEDVPPQAGAPQRAAARVAREQRGRGHRRGHRAPAPARFLPSPARARRAAPGGAAPVRERRRRRRAARPLAAHHEFREPVWRRRGATPAAGAAAAGSQPRGAAAAAAAVHGGAGCGGAAGEGGAPCSFAPCLSNHMRVSTYQASAAIGPHAVLSLLFMNPFLLAGAAPRAGGGSGGGAVGGGGGSGSDDASCDHPPPGAAHALMHQLAMRQAAAGHGGGGVAPAAHAPPPGGGHPPVPAPHPLRFEPDPRSTCWGDAGSAATQRVEATAWPWA